MTEDTHLVAGEAILTGPAPVAHSKEEVLEALVHQHSRLVYRITYAALRSHQDAEDATQETFLRVLRYIHKLPSIEDHKSWLARIAWRVAVHRSRQRNRRNEVTLDRPDEPVAEIVSEAASSDEQLHATQTSLLLDRFIAALPTKLREPLVLSTVEGMSPAEVAATLGINEAAVRSRIFRARQILREKLKAQTENR